MSEPINGHERFTLERSPREHPLQFEGTIIAQVEDDDYAVRIYHTRGGRYVSEFYCDGRGWSRVAVHETLDKACAWFKPGRLTVDLMKLLNRWQPEILE